MPRMKTGAGEGSPAPRVRGYDVSRKDLWDGLERGEGGGLVVVDRPAFERVGRQEMAKRALVFARIGVRLTQREMKVDARFAVECRVVPREALHLHEVRVAAENV